MMISLGMPKKVPAELDAGPYPEQNPTVKDVGEISPGLTGAGIDTRGPL